MNSCIHCHKTQQLGSITYSARSRPNWLCCLAGGFYNLQISCQMYSEPLRHTLTNKMTYLQFHLKSTQHTRFPKNSIWKWFRIPERFEIEIVWGIYQNIQLVNANKTQYVHWTLNRIKVLKTHFVRLLC